LKSAKHSWRTLLIGPEIFITLVDGISAHLLYPDLPGAPPPPFGETLRFTVRYAEFHHTRLEGRRADAAGELADLFSNDLVPRSWWGLLLTDAAELLSGGTFLASLYTLKAHTSPIEDDMILTVNEVHTLLARLEEIYAKEYFGQGSAGEYLVALRRRTRLESDAEALERLESVRLNFVRYASKCMMSGIGGEGSLLETPMVM
jgi:nuclear pore complex protein Nup85